jgi:serine/threonine protein kinase
MSSKCLKRSSAWRKAFRSASLNTDGTPQGRTSSLESHPPKMESNTLEHKYGRPDKMLSNDGAGGSILLVTRRRDHTTFAVKHFTTRQYYEDEQSYTRKIVAEYYVGACLHHPNIIKTLDLFEEYGSWLAVMEYAPYCLFDRVMSRNMSADEISCTFMQILAGTNYLHRSGFAHQDLKLENVVITDNGIMKLIDFGSTITCKEPGRRNATGKPSTSDTTQNQRIKTTQA